MSNEIDLRETTVQGAYPELDYFPEYLLEEVGADISAVAVGTVIHFANVSYEVTVIDGDLYGVKVV